MTRLMKKIVIATLLAFFMIFTCLLFIKIMAYRGAVKEDSLWNDQNKCELVTYIPDYRPYGAPGRLLRLFSNQSFFIVYDKDGNKLKSSAWYFWQAQFSDLMAPEWHGQFAVYPTSDGWAEWRIPACG
ncbi:hypothetical protein E4Z61_08810 [Citrobacter tructae]|uniref:DUF943 family protein n=2 Tax=Enterobacteriaceae TaxID=543 RepID=A0ABX5T5B3_9ENTR|nr:hypothetical protein E4Z61_08810 [Citrobacter tructae]